VIVVRLLLGYLDRLDESLHGLVQIHPSILALFSKCSIKR
jgi:hypothetical protein